MILLLCFAYIYVCFPRGVDDESIVQLKQLIKLIKQKDEIGGKSLIEKHIQSKKQVYLKTT